MIDFAIGVAACATLYTFFPGLAAFPSRWLRAAWDRHTGPDDSDEAGA